MPKIPSYWTVLSMLEWATDYFDEKSVKSPRLSIEWLLAHVLSVKRLDLYLQYDRPLTEAELKTLRSLVKRRASHEPLQYITGETDFLHAKIKVEPGVLIPRQETEQLVEMVLKQNSNKDADVIDIGTGSGCIPVSLKIENPDWKLTATDISDEALNIARENAAINNVNINFLKDDIFAPNAFPLEQKFDIIISNPPYILPDEKDTLDDEVARFEPKEALFCTSTEKMYGAIEQFSKAHLKENGRVYLELHERHSEEVNNLFLSRNWRAEVASDYSDKPRYLIAAKS